MVWLSAVLVMTLYMSASFELTAHFQRTLKIIPASPATFLSACKTPNTHEKRFPPDTPILRWKVAFFYRTHTPFPLRERKLSKLTYPKKLRNDMDPTSPDLIADLTAIVSIGIAVQSNMLHLPFIARPT